MSKVGTAKAKTGNAEVIDPKKMDMLTRRVQRNIARVHNPHLRPGQRGCHHGYNEPRKFWQSRLEQAMEEYKERHEQD